MKRIYVLKVKHLFKYFARVDKIGQHPVSTSGIVFAGRKFNQSLEAARPKTAGLRGAGMSNLQRFSFA